MSLNSNDLLCRLQALTADLSPSRWIVAFSGGIDSTVLLHALANAQTDVSIVAAHVDHGLQTASASWSEHCSTIAAQLNVEFVSLPVTVSDERRKGPEAAARKARYAALSTVVRTGDCLLSAHHQDDQAETLLLNLMRGSGPAGIAGIGTVQSFGDGHLLRPLIGVSGQAIRAYAERHQLSWIDDPSNNDQQLDRNFLRHEIIPRLAARWPAVSERLNRSAELFGEASVLLNVLADLDLEQCAAGEKINIRECQKYPVERQRNMLRRAVRLGGLPSPPATRLDQIVHQLIPARRDAEPVVKWSGVEVRRYRDHLYFVPGSTTTAATEDRQRLPDKRALELGRGFGSITIVPVAGRGISADLVRQGLEIGFRDGGEEIRVERNGSTRKLKTLFQEEGVLPWMRSRIPLIFAQGALIAVGDLWVSADHSGEPGFAVLWQDKPSIR